MTALSVEQMLAWLEKTSTEWKKLLAEHPEALALPCDVMGVGDVAGLMQHIVAVELRYLEGLSELPITSYEQIPKSTAEELFATHDRAMALLGDLLARPDFDWEQRNRVRHPQRRYHSCSATRYSGASVHAFDSTLCAACDAGAAAWDQAWVVDGLSVHGSNTTVSTRTMPRRGYFG